MLMNANMKILDNFIMETSMNTDNSLDSFSSDLDSNQSLIDEVENYLLAASGGESTTIGLDEAPEIEFKEVLRGPAAKYIGIGRSQKQLEMSTVENNKNSSKKKNKNCNKYISRKNNKPTTTFTTTKITCNNNDMNNI